MTLDEIKKHWENRDFDDFDDSVLLNARRTVAAEHDRLSARYGNKLDDVFEEISLLNNIDFNLGELIRIRCESRITHEEALRLQIK